jgi:23S rRNA pseudouridine2605 synthase
LETWRRGVVLEDGHRTQPATVFIESSSGKGAWVRVVMKEGHKRQIRETTKMIGLFVVRLVRVRIASLELGSLKSGISRELTSEEVLKLKNTFKAKGRPKQIKSG